MMAGLGAQSLFGLCRGLLEDLGGAKHRSVLVRGFVVVRLISQVLPVQTQLLLRQERGGYLVDLRLVQLAADSAQVL
jgi:hypothetical protein